MKILLIDMQGKEIADLQSPHLNIDENGLHVNDSRKEEPIEGSSQEFQDGELKTSPDIEGLRLRFSANYIIIKPISFKENFRNILIVGRTGSGKSSLANVLTDTSYFKESAYAVSQTKNFNKIDFKWNDKNFRVVNSIEVGDTKLSTENTLFKIVEGILSMPEG
ncbi:hypothetical protein RhiirA4_498594 [Rhizophagus irregularis]|uniref:AIG1-type G domain-containing protein n=1 Tax=Rhizophagus irregularis TaxID=588596 RepID=A0A2I1H310_9GLOM|nr:hypothetical protein RhiirA4_498594 [Rhizophagus irregularis]